MTSIGSTSGFQPIDPTTTDAADSVDAAADTTATPETSTIAIGARGEEVHALQKDLTKLGFLRGDDGIFGRGTQRAVTLFQKHVGLPTSGEVDQATRDALAQELELGGKRLTSGTPRNDIVFLGMGDGARFEVRDLQKRAGVVGIYDNENAEDDHVSLNVAGRKTTFDLTTDEGVNGFVAGLGVSGSKAEECAELINMSGRDAKDETALLVKAFVEAERGTRDIQRLVLSGHSVGTGVWGDNNGDFDLDTLKAIAKAFPRATAEVEDFLIAGCYSSSEAKVEEFREIFPNLKTSWAYGDSAPGTWSGAMIHNKVWEEATRGDDYAKLDRSLAAGTRKGENVATWNVETGYMADGELRAIADVMRDVEEGRTSSAAFLSGEQEVHDTQRGPLRDHYRNIQEALGNPALAGGERPGLEAERDQTIRMIFYDHVVKGKIQANYGEKITAGFEELGLEVPNFAELSRKDALAAVAGFEEQLAASGRTDGAAAELLPILTGGVRDLSKTYVPNNWV